MATESIKIPTISAEVFGNSLTIQSSTGRKLVMDLHNLAPEIREMATMHGLKQKLVDAAAIARNPDTGRSATADDKFDAIAEVYNRLMSGQWNKGRGEGTGESGGLLFRALCRLYSAKTPEAIRAYLGTLTKEQHAALRKTGKVAAMIETIRAESAKTDGIDGDALLDGLED